MSGLWFLPKSTTDLPVAFMTLLLHICLLGQMRPPYELIRSQASQLAVADVVVPSGREVGITEKVSPFGSGEIHFSGNAVL